VNHLTIQSARTHCISCKTPLSEDIVHIGSQFPSAIFLGENDPVSEGLTASSLNVTRCPDPACRLVQLSNSYDLQYVFDHYPYESGSTATMRQILRELVDDALRVVALKPEDVVLDIGGNDGTLLSLVTGPVRARVNIDAAAAVTQCVTASNYHHVHARFSAEQYTRLNLPQPRLITSVAMFYHLNDPLQFCREVCSVMDENSVWVIQMTYLGTMLRDNIFDNIVHEHSAYYSLASLEALLQRVGLRICEARIVESYGGSLRVFVTKDAAPFPTAFFRKTYPEVEHFERINHTNSYEALYAFNSRTQLLRDSIRSMLEHILQLGQAIWGFGASTKGNMILQYLGLTQEHIPFILDNSPKKIGTRTTGSLIPIVEETAYLEDPPTYLFVLPYYYTQAFVKIIRKRLKPGRSVHLFIPLPHPHFITVHA
jgi:NDP-4-keto-2,6-dideoxyhexose 3-C-methyltransferase